MALPSEFRTEKSIFLENELKKLRVDELENLTNEDFTLLGMYIQTFNFIDLNIQRCINMLEDKAILIFDKKVKQNIPYLIEKFISNLDKLNLEKEQEIQAKENLTEIKYRRSVRNIFAHFACKRIPDQDAFLFMTNTPQDMKKGIRRQEISPDSILYAIFDIADVRAIINHVLKYETWLAKFTEKILQTGDKK